MSTNEIIADEEEGRDFLEVQVLPDLIDFSQVKYVKVSLLYEDPANGINAKEEVTFVANAKDAFTWRVALKDRGKTEYRWQATYFMDDGSTNETPMVTTEEPSVIPQLARAANA